MEKHGLDIPGGMGRAYTVTSGPVTVVGLLELAPGWFVHETTHLRSNVFTVSAEVNVTVFNGIAVFSLVTVTVGSIC